MELALLGAPPLPRAASGRRPRSPAAGKAPTRGSSGGASRPPTPPPSSPGHRSSSAGRLPLRQPAAAATSPSGGAFGYPQLSILEGGRWGPPPSARARGGGGSSAPVGSTTPGGSGVQPKQQPTATAAKGPGPAAAASCRAALQRSASGTSWPSSRPASPGPSLLVPSPASLKPPSPPSPPPFKGGGTRQAPPPTWGKPRSAGGTPGSNSSHRRLPFQRTFHPAAVLDAALLTPCSSVDKAPIAEVPLDEKGRAYPYVLPPCFPGAYPTVAFLGLAQQKQLAGLHPLLRIKVWTWFLHGSVDREEAGCCKSHTFSHPLFFHTPSLLFHTPSH